MDTNNTGAQNQGGSAGSSGKKLWCIIGAVVVIALVWWLFSGMFTRNAAERALERATGGEVEYGRDGTTTYSNGETSVTVGGSSYPSSWPSDAPKYGNGDIQYSGSSNPQTGNPGAAVVFVTNDSASAVISFYERELKAAGWNIEAIADIAGSKTLAASKNGRTFGVWAAQAGNKTQVTVGIEM